MKPIFPFLLNIFKILSLVFTTTIFSQTVSYDSIPAFYQLYARNKTDNDSAIVTVKGTVDDMIKYDSIIVEIDTNNVLWKKESQFLNYNEGTASFLMKPKIYADTVEFSFEIKFKSDTIVTSDTMIDKIVCGDVFLIQGQSNALAYDPVFFKPYQLEWVRSFGTMTDKDGVDINRNTTTATDTTWGLARADLLYSHLSVGITGLRLGYLISQTYGIPVCIINGAAGGTEIKKHLRNDFDHDDLDTIYGRLLYRAIKASVANKVSAIFWWQGEGNTGGNTGANNYYKRFPVIRTAWRENFVGIEKIYTAQLHVGSGATADRNGARGANFLREYQRILALNDPDTEIMSANDIGGFSTDFTHFTATGYKIIGDRIFGQIRRDFYGYEDTEDLDPPDISRAYFTDEKRNVLVLEFDNSTSLFWQKDTTINRTKRFMKDYFYLHTLTGVDSFVVKNGQILNGNLLRLELSGSSQAESVSYLPVSYYNRELGSASLYEGPWLRNSKDIPTLSFYKFPISSFSQSKGLNYNQN